MTKKKNRKKNRKKNQKNQKNEKNQKKNQHQQANREHINARPAAVKNMKMLVASQTPGGNLDLQSTQQ